MSYKIPDVGDAVYAEVLRITNKGAECRIIGEAPYRGLIRPFDMAPSMMLNDSPYRPGDLVKAKVISLGDSKSYFLSTMAEDCGVLAAGSADVSVPVAWNLIADEKLQKVLVRKVARVQSEHPSMQ